MEVKEYTVIVETFYDDDQPVVTGWIEGIDGAIVQCESLPQVFRELGTQLQVIDELKNKP